MRAQDIQKHDGPTQCVAGQVGGAEGPAQLSGFLFPSCDLNGKREHGNVTCVLGDSQGEGGGGAYLSAP